MQAAKRVLDRYETLVASLDEIYLIKHEAAVRGLQDNLVKPKIIAMVCFLTNVLQLTKKLQRFLQASQLNFMEIPQVVNQLIEKLKARDDSNFPRGCYYG